jgi:hypothetical protein
VHIRSGESFGGVLHEPLTCLFSLARVRASPAINAKRSSRVSARVQTNQRTAALQRYDATGQRRLARCIFDANLGQLCVGPNTGGQLRVLGGCDAWTAMCSNSPLVGSHVAMPQRPVAYMATENPAWPMCLARPCKTTVGQLINCHDLMWL